MITNKKTNKEKVKISLVIIIALGIMVICIVNLTTPAPTTKHELFSSLAIFTSLFTINAIEKKGIEGIRVCVGLGLVGVFVLLTIYSFIII